MHPLRQTVQILCLLLCTVVARAQQPLTDSLQHVLAHTADPARQVRLLLDLKDLNEDTPLNLSYSIRLFQKAVVTGDTYAMTNAVVPIIARYALYPEKADSLAYCIRKLRELTPGTPEEGADSYARMAVEYYRLSRGYDRNETLALSHRVLERSREEAQGDQTVYEKARRLLVEGYARVNLLYHKQGIRRPMVCQTACWEEAYALTHRMPNILVRKNFCNIIYYVLSGAYNQARKYEELEALTRDYIGVMDAYYAREAQLGRRPYLYKDNSYVNPYRQLLQGAMNIGRREYAERHFEAFRRRMMNAGGRDLQRNKSYLYELGYLWHANEREYDRSLAYCDSLMRLIREGKSYFLPQSSKVYQVYRDRSRILELAGRYDEAFDAYALTTRVQDSLLSAERRERARTLRLRHEMDRRKLDQTRRAIRNRAVATASMVAVGAVLLLTAAYLYRALRRNRRLQADIRRHSLKAQESERMKSNFINSICRGIGPPYKAIESSTLQLIVAGMRSPDRLDSLRAIRRNTEVLLSALDNMLEAANLDSLSEPLRLHETDIDEACRAELLSAARLYRDKAIDFRIDAPGTACRVPTHEKYFRFVVRALLDNAGKYTAAGSVVLCYRLDPVRGELRIEVTDTGCGIEPSRREELFRPFTAGTVASAGLSLSLSRIIVDRLGGTIRLDTTYTAGARFLFTIPLDK